MCRVLVHLSTASVLDFIFLETCQNLSHRVSLHLLPGMWLGIMARRERLGEARGGRWPEFITQGVPREEHRKRIFLNSELSGFSYCSKIVSKDLNTFSIGRYLMAVVPYPVTRVTTYVGMRHSRYRVLVV